MSNVIDIVQGDHFIVVSHAADVATRRAIHQILDLDASYIAVVSIRFFGPI